MGPSAILDRFSEALRGKDGKFPEVFRLLGDAKGNTQVWLDVAKAALQNCELERSKRILEALLEHEPKNSAACLLLSNACQQLGDPEDLDESILVARSAVVHATSASDTLRATVQLAVSLGTRARIQTRPETERQRDRAEGIQLLSNLDAVASTWDTSGVGAGALFTLALLQAEQGQPQAAMATVHTALQAAQAARRSQLTALCLALVAMLLSSRRKYKLALSVLSAAQPAPATSGATQADAAPVWSDVLLGRLRARLLAAQADTAGSLAALAQCKKLLSGWAEGRVPRPAGVNAAVVDDELVQVWTELALALAASGQRAEAMAAVDHALALRPWHASTRHALGAVQEALGRYDEAAVSYNEALALDPTHAPTLLRQGALHARRGSQPDLAVARDLLTESLRYDPTCAAAWYQLGRVAAALEHRTEAEGLLLTAVQLATAAPALEYRELPLALPDL